MNGSVDRSTALGIGRGFALVIGLTFVASCSAATSSPSASSAATTAAATAPPVAAPVVSASASSSDVTASEAPSGTPLATAVATAIDPCQLVTPAEASMLTGVSYSAGKESTTEGHGKLCHYSQAGSLFTVIVGQAPDEATAKAGEQQAIAQLQQAAAKGLKLTQLPGFADGVDAATLSGSQSLGGQTIAATAIFLLKGTTFVGITDVATLGAKAPTEQQLQDQAKVTLTRLP